jgi:hypothetical protein
VHNRSNRFVCTWICRRIQPSLPSLLLTEMTRSDGGAHCTRRAWMLMRPPLGDGLAICGGTAARRRLHAAGCTKIGDQDTEWTRGMYVPAAQNLSQ